MLNLFNSSIKFRPSSISDKDYCPLLHIVTLLSSFQSKKSQSLKLKIQQAFGQLQTYNLDQIGRASFDILFESYDDYLACSKNGERLIELLLKKISKNSRPKISLDLLQLLAKQHNFQKKLDQEAKILYQAFEVGLLLKNKCFKTFRFGVRAVQLITTQQFQQKSNCILVALKHQIQQNGQTLPNAISLASKVYRVKINTSEQRKKKNQQNQNTYLKKLFQKSNSKISNHSKHLNTIDYNTLRHSHKPNLPINKTSTKTQNIQINRSFFNKIQHMGQSWKEDSLKKSQQCKQNSSIIKYRQKNCRQSWHIQRSLKMKQKIKSKSQLLPFLILLFEMYCICVLRFNSEIKKKFYRDNKIQLKEKLIRQYPGRNIQKVLFDIQLQKLKIHEAKNDGKLAQDQLLKQVLVKKNKIGSCKNALKKQDKSKCTQSTRKNKNDECIQSKMISENDSILGLKMKSSCHQFTSMGKNEPVKNGQQYIQVKGKNHEVTQNRQILKKQTKLRLSRIRSKKLSAKSLHLQGSQKTFTQTQLDKKKNNINCSVPDEDQRQESQPEYNKQQDKLRIIRQKSNQEKRKQKKSSILQRLKCGYKKEKPTLKKKGKLLMEEKKFDKSLGQEKNEILKTQAIHQEKLDQLDIQAKKLQDDILLQDQSVQEQKSVPENINVQLKIVQEECEQLKNNFKPLQTNRWLNQIVDSCLQPNIKYNYQVQVTQSFEPNHMIDNLKQLQNAQILQDAQPKNYLHQLFTGLQNQQNNNHQQLSHKRLTLQDLSCLQLTKQHQNLLFQQDQNQQLKFVNEDEQLDRKSKSQDITSYQLSLLAHQCVQPFDDSSMIGSSVLRSEKPIFTQDSEDKMSQIERKVSNQLIQINDSQQSENSRLIQPQMQQTIYSCILQDKAQLTSIKTIISPPIHLRKSQPSSRKFSQMPLQVQNGSNLSLQKDSTTSEHLLQHKDLSQRSSILNSFKYPAEFFRNSVNNSNNLLGSDANLSIKKMTIKTDSKIKSQNAILEYHQPFKHAVINSASSFSSLKPKSVQLSMVSRQQTIQTNRSSQSLLISHHILKPQLKITEHLVTLTIFHPCQKKTYQLQKQFQSPINIKDYTKGLQARVSKFLDKLIQQSQVKNLPGRNQQLATKPNKAKRSSFELCRKSDKNLPQFFSQSTWDYVVGHLPQINLESQLINLKNIKIEYKKNQFLSACLMHYIDYNRIIIEFRKNPLEIRPVQISINLNQTLEQIKNLFNQKNVKIQQKQILHETKASLQVYNLWCHLQTLPINLKNYTFKLKCIFKLNQFLFKTKERQTKYNMLIQMIQANQNNQNLVISDLSLLDRNKLIENFTVVVGYAVKLEMGKSKFGVSGKEVKYFLSLM